MHVLYRRLLWSEVLIDQVQNILEAFDQDRIGFFRSKKPYMFFVYQYLLYLNILRS